MDKQTSALRRCIVACWAILPHLILPAKLLGDYLIYRTGIAGKLPDIPLPERLLRAWWSVRLAGSFLFLPAVWVAGAHLLGRWHTNAATAVSLSGVMTLGLFQAFRRFNYAWRFVDRYHVGSAKQLSGHCVIFQVFLGTSWRRRDRVKCSLAVRTACDWLEQQARAHRVSLDLTTDPPDLLTLDDVPMS